MIKTTFYGASGGVTGSKHMVSTQKLSFLLDCGWFQGRRQEANLLNQKFPFDSRAVHSVILSHGHLDHCGGLPLLVKQGFKGRIYGTGATNEVASHIMMDAAKIMMQDANFINDHLEINESPVNPIYFEEDVQKVLQHFISVPYFRLKQNWTNIHDTIRFKFYDAGHILGAALTVVEIEDEGTIKRIGFSGDIGKPGAPLLYNPEYIKESLDLLIMESTYGNKNHEPLEEAVNQLVGYVNHAVRSKSVVIIPAFALGRTQLLIYLLHKLTDERRIPRLPIYIDSPLGIKLNEVFERHPEDLNPKTWGEFSRNSELPLDFRNLDYVESIEESRTLNDKDGPFIVIASSGMCEGGRVLHHLSHHIEDKNTVILITGYQAEHTLGRKLQMGISPVNIFGRPHKLRARVLTLDQFSAHADRDSLLEYLRHIPQPKQIALVHGESEQRSSFADIINKQFPKIKVHIPGMGDEIII